MLLPHTCGPCLCISCGIWRNGNCLWFTGTGKAQCVVLLTLICTKGSMTILLTGITRMEIKHFPSFHLVVLTSTAHCGCWCRCRRCWCWYCSRQGCSRQGHSRRGHSRQGCSRWHWPLFISSVIAVKILQRLLTFWVQSGTWCPLPSSVRTFFVMTLLLLSLVHCCFLATSSNSSFAEMPHPESIWIFSLASL